MRRDVSEGLADINPYVFVVGSARSGTTLLQRMLDHHPELAVANDTHFIPWAVSHGASADTPMTPALASSIFGYRRFHRFGLSEADVMNAANAPTFAGFVAALYDEFGRKHGKALAGEKTPEYVRHIPLLHALFPRAKFVHISRDGRDVALSVRKWATKDRPADERGSTLRGPARHELFADHPFGAIALWWAEQERAGADAGAVLGAPMYHHLRYEDLVEAPEATLGEIAAFLGLADAPEMAAYHVGKQQERAGRSAKKAWMPATKGVRDWRNEMSASDAALFEALAGEELTRFGYPLEAPSCDIDVIAAECRSRWSTKASQGRSGAESAHAG